MPDYRFRNEDSSGYQSLMPTVMAPRRLRRKDFRIRVLLDSGTDGSRIIYPVRGIDQVETTNDSGPRSSRLLVGYVLALAGSAVVVAVVLHQVGYTLGNIWVLAALCLAAAITERASVRVSGTTELSISPVLTLFAAVLFGPLAGGVVGAASELGDGEIFRSSRQGRSVHLKWLTYSSTRFMAGAAMGSTAAALQGRARFHRWALRRHVAASAVGELLELAFATVTSRIRGNVNGIPRLVGPLMVTAVCVYAPVVGALASPTRDLSVVCFFVPRTCARCAAAIQSLSREGPALRGTTLSIRRS